MYTGVLGLGKTTRLMITFPIEEIGKLARLATERRTSIAEQVRQAVYDLPDPATKQGRPVVSSARTLDYSEGQ